jgi:hypothetical protein
MRGPNDFTSPSYVSPPSSDMANALGALVAGAASGNRISAEQLADKAYEMVRAGRAPGVGAPCCCLGPRRRSSAAARRPYAAVC